MPDKKLTDNEIKKALEQRTKDLPCIHEKYEPACGVWCEHLHMWCIDFNNKSLKEKCSEYKPCCSMRLEKQAFDLINRLQAENDNLSHNNRQMTKDILGLHKALKQAKAENERLADTLKLYRNYNPAIRHARTEAYKECIEKVKEQSNKMELVCSGALVRTDYTTTEEALNNLSKELDGDNNA